jgi:hypothetical protein
MRGGKRGHDPTPYASPTPAGETIITSRIGARQVAPRCARSQHPKDTTEDTVVVHTRDPAWLVRQHRPDGSPLAVGEFIGELESRHDSRSQAGRDRNVVNPASSPLSGRSGSGPAGNRPESVENDPTRTSAPAAGLGFSVIISHRTAFSIPRASRFLRAFIRRAKATEHRTDQGIERLGKLPRFLVTLFLRVLKQGIVCA